MHKSIDKRPSPQPKVPRRLVNLMAKGAAVAATLTALSTLTACQSTPDRPSTNTGATLFANTGPFKPQPCPAGVPEGTRCLYQLDAQGAHQLVALPRDWSGVLVLHNHGGPSLGQPQMSRALGDLQRWAVVVKAGHAWAGSSFAQGGVAVRAAAADSERLRQAFVQHVGVPRRTVLHGQSWGASVAAKQAEAYPGTVDAVLLSSGVLAGGTRAYDQRLDLRVVYQALCNNHPLPEEAAYPLWQGLPPGSRLTREQLAQRAGQCLGLGLPQAQRNAQQRQRLDTLVKVVGIPEHAVMGHLQWATWHFQDIAQHRTGGGNVFGNQGVRYRGSPDDDALNAQVARYVTDPAAIARFADDADPNGQIKVPVLSVHGVGDTTAVVEMDSVFADTMARAGNADRLVQTFTRDAEHSYLADPVYPALLDALLDWVDHGRKPTPQSVAARCLEKQASFGPGCRFDPDYRPGPMSGRALPR